MSTAKPGGPVPPDQLIDVEAVRRAYVEGQPDPQVASQRVKFGTSGHRGRATALSFNEPHVAAISQAVCDYRAAHDISGPLFLGMDTHALSAPAQQTAVEVFAANAVQVVMQADGGFTPTPVISWAILRHNRDASAARADGVVITPSHNPPEDGGFKYNPPEGGPADSGITGWIEQRANAILESGEGVRRMSYDEALASDHVRAVDLVTPYVDDLPSVVDIAAIRDAGVRIGVDPLGGAGVQYWQAIAERHGLDLTVVNPEVDPAFGFMTLDHDGRVRMDCSSPYAMAGLIGMRDAYDVAIGNDPDADRHGIVSPSAGLLNPNHFLALCVEYLFTHRPDWPETAKVGKTLVSSALIDRVAKEVGTSVYEVPVGFKWLAGPLYEGDCAFGGEESAGASLLRRDGSVWTTDKDGIALGLLAAEIRARTGQDLGERFEQLTARLGRPLYRRLDIPASAEARTALGALDPASLGPLRLGDEDVQQALSHAPGNDAPIGGAKMVAESGWIAVRPSGTEDIAKVYAESFRDEAHLESLLETGRTLVERCAAPPA
ncbi:MAG: phosphoglucomutase (alpha-D-glucose-1,6-bisphosphate-dependent) [Planctomycetota bacterium]|nr:phosphoglucomutase (alpha-D-glucose-1,6-bisphosphate-dependent) [Planctomycetota bacterium]